MNEHLEERRRFSELYCPGDEYEEHIAEEIKTIEKKIGIGTNWLDWLREPGFNHVVFCAVSDLPILYTDEYAVVFRNELDALKKRARDVGNDQLMSLPRKE